MSLFLRKIALFSKPENTRVFSEIFLSHTRNPGFKLLSKIGNANQHKARCHELAGKLD